MATYFSDITSADVQAYLTVEELYPGGIKLQQFSTDQAMSMDEVQVTETRMGVDGYMAVGYTPPIYPVTIMFEPSSPSVTSLNFVLGNMQSNNRTYECTLTVTYRTKSYTWSDGVLKSAAAFPSAKKIQDPVTWKFDFARFTVIGI